MKKVLILAIVFGLTSVGAYASFEGGTFSSSGYNSGYNNYNNQPVQTYKPQVQQPQYPNSYTAPNTNGIVIYYPSANNAKSPIVNNLSTTSGNYSVNSQPVVKTQTYNNPQDTYKPATVQANKNTTMSSGRISYAELEKILKNDEVNEYYIKEFEKYSNNEQTCYQILDNYNQMKNLDVLSSDAIVNWVLTKIDWNTYNGNNYALDFAKRLQNSGKYSKEDIKYWLGAVDWSQIKNPPIEQVADIVNKGYLKYFDVHISEYYKKPSQLNNKTLTTLVQCIELARNAGWDDNIIKHYVSWSNWEKPDETYEMLQYLIANNMSNDAIGEFSYNSYREFYDIYETVQNNSEYTDKALAFKKEFKRRQRKLNFERGAGNVVDATGKVLLVPAAAATAPLWIPAMLLMAPALP